MNQVALVGVFVGERAKPLTRRPGYIAPASDLPA